jgi:hypothetical protein
MFQLALFRHYIDTIFIPSSTEFKNVAEEEGYSPKHMHNVDETGSSSTIRSLQLWQS